MLLNVLTNTHHDEVGQSATCQLLHHRKRLFHGLGLIDQELAQVAAHTLGMQRVHGVFDVDKCNGTIHFLHLPSNGECQGGLATGLAAINLDDAAGWDAPTECNIQGGDASGDELYLVVERHYFAI